VETASKPEPRKWGWGALGVLAAVLIAVGVIRPSAPSNLREITVSLAFLVAAGCVAALAVSERWTLAVRLLATAIAVFFVYIGAVALVGGSSWEMMPGMIYPVGDARAEGWCRVGFGAGLLLCTWLMEQRWLVKALGKGPADE